MLHSVLCIISTTTSFVGIFVRFTINYNNFVMHFIRLIVYCFNPLPVFFKCLFCLPTNFSKHYGTLATVLQVINLLERQISTLSNSKTESPLTIKKSKAPQYYITFRTRKLTNSSLLYHFPYFKTFTWISI